MALFAGEQKLSRSIIDELRRDSNQAVLMQKEQRKILIDVGADEAACGVRVTAGALDNFDELAVRQRDWGRGWSGPGGGRGGQDGCKGEMA